MLVPPFFKVQIWRGGNKEICGQSGAGCVWEQEEEGGAYQALIHSRKRSGTVDLHSVSLLTLKPQIKPAPHLKTFMFLVVKYFLAHQTLLMAQYFSQSSSNSVQSCFTGLKTASRQKRVNNLNCHKLLKGGQSQTPSQRESEAKQPLIKTIISAFWFEVKQSSTVCKRGAVRDEDSKHRCITRCHLITFVLCKPVT